MQRSVSSQKHTEAAGMCVKDPITFIQIVFNVSAYCKMNDSGIVENLKSKHIKDTHPSDARNPV